MMLLGKGLFILGICALIYFAVVIIADFSWIWIVAGLFFCLSGLAFSMDPKQAGFVLPLQTVCGVCLIMGAAATFVLGSMIFSGMLEKPGDDLEYILVLGAQVKGQEPSVSLRKRLEAAYEYGIEHPDVTYVLCGGQGSGEDISEAACMQRYLLEKGIPKEKLLMEDTSTSTWENLVFADRLYHLKQAKTGIVSNNFHIYRALRLAKKLEYTQVSGIPAGFYRRMQLHFIVREMFALVKELLTGRMGII